MVSSVSFSQGSICNYIQPSNKICRIYLSSWNVDFAFLEKFLSLSGDKYIKLHPHIKHAPEKINNKASFLPTNLPAEVIVMLMTKSYENVTIYHHGSSLAKYIPNTPLCQDSCHFSPREFVLGSGAKESDNNYEQQVFQRVQRKHYREDATSRECTSSRPSPGDRNPQRYPLYLEEQIL